MSTRLGDRAGAAFGRRSAAWAVVTLAALTLSACSSSPDAAVDSVASTQDPTTTLEPLRADFEIEFVHEFVDPTNCPVREVRFIDRSTGSPDSWSWDFGDGETSTEQHPTLSPRLDVVATLTVTRGNESDETTISAGTPVC